MAAPARFERAAYCLGGSRSIHLGYGVAKQCNLITVDAVWQRSKQFVSLLCDNVTP